MVCRMFAKNIGLFSGLFVIILSQLLLNFQHENKNEGNFPIFFLPSFQLGKLQSALDGCQC